jgi:hypothetical protein
MFEVLNVCTRSQQASTEKKTFCCPLEKSKQVTKSLLVSNTERAIQENFSYIGNVLVFFQL